MKKEYAFAALFAFLILVSVLVVAVDNPTWLVNVGGGNNVGEVNRRLATAVGISGGGLGFTSYMKDSVALHGGTSSYGGDMAKNEGIQFFVLNERDNEKKPLFEVYVSDHTLWDEDNSYFVIRGASIYSEFPEQKFLIKDLISEHGADSVYSNLRPYYFPSEDRKTFRLTIELDSGVGWSDDPELIVHKFELLDRPIFVKDIETYFEKDEKVPTSGTGSGPSTDEWWILES